VEFQSLETNATPLSRQMRPAVPDRFSHPNLDHECLKLAPEGIRQYPRAFLLDLQKIIQQISPVELVTHGCYDGTLRRQAHARNVGRKLTHYRG
jgi:hypothetical protein